LIVLLTQKSPRLLVTAEHNAALKNCAFRRGMTTGEPLLAEKTLYQRQLERNARIEKAQQQGDDET
jgi:hypothetical protein